MGDNFSNSPYGEHQYRDSYYNDAMSYGQTEELATNTMAKSFLVMVVALLVTAVTAYVTVSNVGMFVAVYKYFTVFIILELVTVFATSFAINKNNTSFGSTAVATPNISVRSGATYTTESNGNNKQSAIIRIA